MDISYSGARNSAMHWNGVVSHRLHPVAVLFSILDDRRCFPCGGAHAFLRSLQSPRGMEVKTMSLTAVYWGLCQAARIVAILFLLGTVFCWLANIMIGAGICVILAILSFVSSYFLNRGYKERREDDGRSSKDWYGGEWESY